MQKFLGCILCDRVWWLNGWHRVMWILILLEIHAVSNQQQFGYLLKTYLGWHHRKHQRDSTEDRWFIRIKGQHCYITSDTLVPALILGIWISKRAIFIVFLAWLYIFTNDAMWRHGTLWSIRYDIRFSNNHSMPWISSHAIDPVAAMYYACQSQWRATGENSRLVSFMSVREWLHKTRKGILFL